MAKNAMNIKNFVHLAKLMPPDTSMLIRADHGIGKSQIVFQLANHIREQLRESNELGPNEFPFIDMRLGQITEGDMIGLPYQQDGVTRFMPPWWVKQACDEPCLIFLDELNRGTTEVMQAGFQLVLDRRMQDNKLHPQSRVYAAVNTGASYTVNEMDPALLDRFWTIDLVPSVEEWIAWAKDHEDIIDVIVDFIRHNNRFLDPPEDVEPGTIHVSRRSWHRLSRAIQYAKLEDEPGSAEFRHMCLGFIGVEATASFTDFAKNFDRQVSGADVVNKMVRKVNMDSDLNSIKKIGSDEDINVYDDRIVKIISEMGSERHNGMIEKVADYIKKNCKGVGGISVKQGTALSKFCTLLSVELRVSMWTALVGDGVGGVADMEMNKSIHRWCVAHLMAPLGVDIGKAGVGTVPTGNLDVFGSNKMKKGRR